MQSMLSWIDHDPAQRDRMQRILALFRERETRDEMGLGGIRDAFADQLFPGTSTIQTRLKYFLLVPWVYQQTESKRVPSHRIAGAARELELRIVDVLKDQDDVEGMFGRRAGRSVKRLPSSVYWAGLGEWGIRRTPLTQGQYHAAIDLIYQRRSHERRTDEGEVLADLSSITWHPKLPPAPPDFPESTSLAVAPHEARFLQDRIVTACRGSLLALLAARGGGLWSEIETPWAHPDYAEFRPEHHELLHHGRLFAEVAYSAALIYNLGLAMLDDNVELIEARRADLTTWAVALDRPAIESWDLPRFWALVLGKGHTISSATQRFATDWVQLIRSQPNTLADSTNAHRLVRLRETKLKGARSRYVNKRAREQWSGFAGAYRMNYRWFRVRELMADLHHGLEG